MAAHELKRQSWRFHKHHNAWFQRFTEPSVTSEEYEQGGCFNLLVVSQSHARGSRSCRSPGRSTSKVGFQRWFGQGEFKDGSQPLITSEEYKQGGLQQC
eukprot:scaffold17041_cov14-Tisochrysis_lutea.AAC.1